MYAVKEIFYTLQGEGFHAGRPAVFCRFAGCNLWSGREQDRATAVCRFCDTDFVGTDGAGGGKVADAAALAEGIGRLLADGALCSWLGAAARRNVERHFDIRATTDRLLAVYRQLQAECEAQP